MQSLSWVSNKLLPTPISMKNIFTLRTGCEDLCNSKQECIKKNVHTFFRNNVGNVSLTYLFVVDALKFFL